MAKKFNLMDYMSKETDKKEDAETKVLEESIENLVPDKENFYSMDGIEELKQSIEVVGLLQPLLVTEKDENGKRKVIAGHRRLKALQELAEEGKQQYKKVTVMEKKRKDEIIDRLSLIMANRYRDKTEWEKMKETVETDRLLRELKKKENLKGNMRDMLAEITNTNAAKVAMYKVINEKLSPEMMEAFEKGRIGLTVAYKVTQLEVEDQDNLWIKLDENGSLSIKDVDEMKEKKIQEEKTKEEETKEEKYPDENEKSAAVDMEESEMEQQQEEETGEQIAGQMEIVDYPEVVPEEMNHAAVKQEEVEQKKEDETLEKKETCTDDGLSDRTKEEFMVRLRMMKKMMEREGLMFDLEFERLELGKKSLRSLNILKKQDYINGEYDKALKLSLNELNEGLI